MDAIPLNKTKPISFPMKPIKLETLRTIQPLKQRLDQTTPQQLQQSQDMTQNTVFRLNGKIIGALADDGSATFFSNSISPTGGRQFHSRLEWINQLKQRYGERLAVEQYPPGHGPSAEEIKHEVYGRNVMSLDLRA